MLKLEAAVNRSELEKRVMRSACVTPINVHGGVEIKKSPLDKNFLTLYLAVADIVVNWGLGGSRNLASRDREILSPSLQ